MEMKDIIKPDLIIDDVSSTDKNDVIGELVDKLNSYLGIDNNNNIKQILIDREEMGSTGIGDHIAIPHAKVNGIKGLVSVFGRSKKGIEFRSLDGKPVYLLCLLLSDEQSTNELLSALSQVSRLLLNKDVRENLINAEDKDRLYEIICNEICKTG
jgi:PTS system nitrogen regulatory IIA component